MTNSPKKKWLILSYLANRDANACSQHIDDKLLPLLDRGIEPILLSGVGGKKHTAFPHESALSIAPSGLRNELRNFLRTRCTNKFTFKLFETPLLIPILPFYLLEKIFLDFDDEWSWYFRARQKGIKLCSRYHPELIYSTGGSASAHIAASHIAKTTGLPWIAELQDPLIHDKEYHRNKRAFRYYQNLETMIRKNSCATLFMCDSAKENCNTRTGNNANSYTVYPGAKEHALPAVASKKQHKHCIFSHFGSLGGTRSAAFLIPALQKCIEQNPEFLSIIRLNLYGTCDAESHKLIANFPFPDIIAFHGKIPREAAVQKMSHSSCLVLIQNTEFYSSETIPSKLYEYMLTGRPVLGLTFQNKEIDNLLLAEGHFSVAADNVDKICTAITAITKRQQSGHLQQSHSQSPWTASRAVDQLLSVAKTCRKQHHA
jgi:hypothetical protein